MEELLKALILGLASWATLNAWFLSSLFVPVRRKLQDLEEIGEWLKSERPNAHLDERLIARAMGMLTALLSCRFCMSFHVPFWPQVVGWWIWGTSYAQLGTIAGISLAATALVSVLDRLMIDFVSFDALQAAEEPPAVQEEPLEATVVPTPREPRTPTTAYDAAWAAGEIADAAGAAMDRFPDLESVSIAFAFRPGVQSRTPGFILGKGGDARFPSELLRMLDAQRRLMESSARKLEGLVAGVVKVGEEEAAKLNRKESAA